MTTTISPLRQRMIEDMNGRELTRATQQGHIRACQRFAAFLGRSPEDATPEYVRRRLYTLTPQRPEKSSGNPAVDRFFSGA